MPAVDARTETVVVPVTDSAAEHQAALVNRDRARLLQSGSAVVIRQIAQATGRTTSAVSKAVERERDAGTLATVKHAGVTYIPSFQLDEAFEFASDASQVVERLLDAGMTGWAVWRWATSPNTWLDDATPAERLAAGRVDEVHAAVSGLLQA